MDEPPQRPRRTPTVMLLDMSLNPLAAAVATVALVTAALAVTVLRAPDELVPLGTTPWPAVATRERPGGAVPSAQPNASPAESRSPSQPMMPANTGPAMPGPSATAGPTGKHAPRAALSARYARQDDGGSLLSYRASVTVHNPGGVPVTGWTLTVTLPRRTLTISDVTGASAHREGAAWTFTPDPGTATVPAHRSVLVSFHVNGAATVAANPVACTIDAHPCDGLSPPVSH